MLGLWSALLFDEAGFRAQRAFREKFSKISTTSITRRRRDYRGSRNSPATLALALRDDYQHDIGEIEAFAIGETRVCYVFGVKNRRAGSLTYDVVRLLHHGRLRRIHNGAATTRDCVLATSYPHPRSKDIVPG